MNKAKFSKFTNSFAVPAFLAVIIFAIFFSYYKYVIQEDFVYELPPEGEMPEILE